MERSIRWRCIAIAGCLASAAYGNNLSVTNVALVNVTNGTADIQFDVSWDNSWRYDEMAGGGIVTNHDAAWVFFKYRAGGDWKHLHPADSGHAAAPGTAVKLASNGGGVNVGAFVFRDADGHGGLLGTGMRLHWDYVADGLIGTNGVDISVHGIEMVYIPRGGFFLGTGGVEANRFYRYPGPEPFAVTNDDETAIGTVTGNLYYALDSWTGSMSDGLGPLPAAFPMGFDAFYCMKHEITQGLYAQFLNRVPAGTDGARFPNAYGTRRHTIRLTDGVYVADAPDRACNYIAWQDIAVFLDWAGLRPMSETEYEKVCRGPLAPIPYEYAWGSTAISSIGSIVGGDGSGTETVSGGNAHVGRTSAYADFGPVRVGIFATASSTRQQAGAGYHGVMELTGNLNECTVTIGNPQGRAFAGSHGDGDTSSPNPDWPDVSTAVGTSIRGGDFGESTHLRPASSRYASISAHSARTQSIGGRGVRSAP